MRTPELDAFLRTLPGRCAECLWHEEKQGHAPGCGVPVSLARRGMDQTVAADKAGETAIIDAAIKARIRAGGEWSINDLRPELAGIQRQSLIGARVNAFAARRAIREVGRVPSTKGNTHGHKIAIWRAA